MATLLVKVAAFYLDFLAMSFLLSGTGVLRSAQGLVGDLFH